MDWQDFKVRNTNIEGARASFEEVCGTLLKSIYKEEHVQLVRVSKGDGGIDIFIGDIGENPIRVFQCKFFLDEFEDSQKQQVRESFKTAITSNQFKMNEWNLCMPFIFDIEQHRWWATWTKRMKDEYSLPEGFIKLIDGKSLIDLFKENDLFNRVFKVEDSLKLDTIGEKIDAISIIITPEISFKTAQEEIKNACFDFETIVNLFGANPDTHIDRIETQKIFNWITNDLSAKEKNIFVVEGDKGLGKTIVLKDLLHKLNEANIDVLGIKADKYYASDRTKLERKIFQKDNITVEKIVEVYRKKGKNLVIIFDQLDALSLSLSSNREYLYTYNRLIASLAGNLNVRVVISARTYDLEYDAELSIYKNKSYPSIKLQPLNLDQVNFVINKFGIYTKSEKLLQLLTVPGNLDIFCKLPDKDSLDTESITTLKDLFDTLWLQLIAIRKDLRLQEILYKIADAMYVNQKITIRNIFTNYLPEIAYLKSNQLLIESKGELQFFHQMFYDYNFSKQFVELKKPLEQYILKNSQSLYIRSVVKMVLDYLRDFNPDEYHRVIGVIIKSSRSRFHIKTLVITSLAAIKNPSVEEKRVFNKYISHNLKLNEIFINSISSPGWVEFVLGIDLPLQYFYYKRTWAHRVRDICILYKIVPQDFALKYNYREQFDLRLKMMHRLFRANAEHSLFLLVNYFDRIPEFPEKDNFTMEFLKSVYNWESHKTLDLFSKYFDYSTGEGKRNNFWYFQILERIFKYHPEYVYKQIKPFILKVFDEFSFTINFDHDLEQLLEEMNKIDEEKTFVFFLEIFNQLIEENKYQEFFESIGSPLYKNNKFSELFDSDVKENADDFIEKILNDYIKANATNKVFFLLFYEQHKNHNSISHLKLLILGLSEFPGLYKQEIFDFINIIYNKKGFNGYDDKFSLYLRELIGKSFYLMSLDEKNRIAQIILTIKHPADVYYYTDKNNRRKPVLSFYGKKKYLFINILPEYEITDNPQLKKTYQELKRKFGAVTLKQLDESKIRSGGVGPPLALSAYSNMDNQAWKNSILIFGDSYVENRNGDDFRGGKLEHSRKFEQEVSEEPERFYTFIEDLFDDPNVSDDYLSSGVEGLIKANFNAEKVKILYHKLTRRSLNTNNTLYTVWKAEYMIKNRIVDEEIINFLSSQALNHSNPEKELNYRDPLHDSLNSVRGASVYRLIACYYNATFSQTIFETIEKVVNDDRNSVKVAALVNLGYLNYLDIERSFKIFIKLIDTDNLVILKNAFRTAAYYNKNFHNEMRPLFEMVIANIELHENGSYLIVHSWLLGYDRKDEYFDRLVLSSSVAKLKALDVAEENLYQDGLLDINCLSILFQFLNENEEKFAHSYSGFFLRKLKRENFMELYPFMRKYSKSQLFHDDPRYFLDFLLKSSRDFPLECLELIKFMKFDVAPDIRRRGGYDNEPVQLILSIYSSLYNMSVKNEKKIEEALFIFDNMLQHEHLRWSSGKAIETL